MADLSLTVVGQGHLMYDLEWDGWLFGPLVVTFRLIAVYKVTLWEL